MTTTDPTLSKPIPRTSRAFAILRAVGALVAGIAMVVLAGWWFGVKPGEAVSYATGISPWAVVGCALSSFVVFAFQSLRWWLVMRPVLGLRYSQAYAAQVVGMTFNALLPARGGDLLRVQYLGRRTGKSRAVILGTEIVDRWLDWWGWFPVLFVLALTGPVPAWLYKALGLFALILVSWATVMIALSKRGYTPTEGSRFGAAYLSFREGFKQFSSTRTILLALAVAPLPWLWESIVIRWTAHAFGIDLTLAMAFSVLIGFNVAMVVPSPGAVGSVETGGTAALVFFGVDQSKALAFMFVYHFCQLLPGIGAGVAILVAQGEALFSRRNEPEKAAATLPPSSTPIPPA